MTRSVEPPDEPDAGGVRHDWSNTLPSTAVAEALASAETVDATSLAPLYEWFDPDALDEFVRTAADAGTDARVAVTVDGVDVLIDTDGRLVVRPSDPSSPGRE